MTVRPRQLWQHGHFLPLVTLGLIGPVLLGGILSKCHRHVHRAQADCPHRTHHQNTDDDQRQHHEDNCPICALAQTPQTVYIEVASFSPLVLVRIAVARGADAPRC